MRPTRPSRPTGAPPAEPFSPRRLSPPAAAAQPLVAAPSGSATPRSGARPPSVASEATVCPIGQTALRDEPPATLYRSVVDGQVYIRANLQRWLSAHNTSPVNRAHARADIVRLFPEGRRNWQAVRPAEEAMAGLCGVLVGLGLGGMATTSIVGQALLRPEDPADPDSPMALAPAASEALLVAFLISAATTGLGVCGFELLRRHTQGRHPSTTAGLLRPTRRGRPSPWAPQTPPSPRLSGASPLTEAAPLLDPQLG
jgi:hypothetical protein